MMLEEVSALIVAEGIYTEEALGFGDLPEAPDNAASLYEYPGEEPLHVKDKQAPVLEKPRLQVITRSKSYPTARHQAERIFGLLTGYSGQIEGISYGRIRALQSPYFLSRDNKGRSLIVCNYRISKELSPAI